MINFVYYPSPLGRLILAEEGGFLTGLYLPGSDPPPGAELSDTPLLAACRWELDGYFSGTLRSFSLPLAPEGTPFFKSIWRELAKVPFGETVSYGELAARVGGRRYARAVGLAMNRNPIAIILPCHRVVGAHGALTGYAGGLDAKKWLLAHEKSVVNGGSI